MTIETTKGPLLEVRDLHVYYGHVQALKGISFHVNEGEIVTLIGGNGAGKTTTLHTLSKLLTPRSGEILLGGQPIHKIDADEIVRTGITHVPEGRRIFSRLTVRENLEIGAYLLTSKTEITRRIEASFELFPRLRERERQYGGTLSGGEQQMLAIARALMLDPRIILLDEPSMGLSPLFVEKIFEIIQSVNKSGKTVVLVEQNALMALEIAHRGYVLQSGHVVMGGDADLLAKDPSVQSAYLGGEIAAAL
ncbi:MAG: ABC transporter ATP-binding protein [Hyphomicrobiales bacterium]|nr:ABC transporter ATP-binding protein [Hyphomicrobiales bacterium]